MDSNLQYQIDGVTFLSTELEYVAQYLHEQSYSALAEWQIWDVQSEALARKNMYPDNFFSNHSN